MCGITFCYAPELPSALVKQRTQSALIRMAHRGPDEQGIVADGGWALGHRRLSIIDLRASLQPMSSPDGRYLITYNGEVYNFQNLRERLNGKWRFKTAGDTEVVLAGLASSGASFLSDMEGMWSLAFWDRREERLLLARDRMGKKPLYYRAWRSGFCCASELPVLSVLDGTRWEEDLDSTADYLRHGYYLPGTTAYAGVSEVLPGHWLEWTPGSEVRVSRYWTLPVGGYASDRGRAADELRESLHRAIDRRLVADVEVGAFLSGGVDSSLIVALQAQRSGVPPKTFTIGFRETSYDERKYARLVAGHFKTEHHEGVLESWDSDWLKRLTLDHVGQPFTDSSILPTALVSELAARHVKVVLSGDGGDELFSGYQRYMARAILRWYTRLPRGLRTKVEAMLSLLPEPYSHHSRSILKKMHLFLDVAQRLEDETPYVAPVMYSSSRLKALAPDLEGRGHGASNLPPVCDRDDILQMMVSDALVYLPQDILVKVDRASMAHSLEARAPFLDREVVELAFRMPRGWHRSWFSGKKMLRASFGNSIPNEIWRRRKQGFGVPLGRWFKEKLSDDLADLIHSTSSPLVTREVVKMLDEHVNGERDYGYRLWQVYIYLLWRDRMGNTRAREDSPCRGGG